MSFDEPINRFGTHSVKWDMMERLYGVPAKDGLAMWVADMDFRPPACVQAAVDKMAAHGIYGYFGDDTAYLDAIRWWMATRHGWDVAREDIGVDALAVQQVGFRRPALPADVAAVGGRD